MLYSVDFLTSRILISFLFFASSCVAVSWIILFIFLPFFSHERKDPFKYPTALSYPTLANRVTTSSSLPSGQTITIFWFISFIKLPTQGANPPSIPINQEPGINPLTKSFWCLTSKIKAPFFTSLSKSSILNGFDPVIIISSTVLFIIVLLSLFSRFQYQILKYAT